VRSTLAGNARIHRIGRQVSSSNSTACITANFGRVTVVVSDAYFMAETAEPWSSGTPPAGRRIVLINVDQAGGGSAAYNSA